MASLPKIPGLPGLESTPLSGFFYDPSKDNEAALAGINRGTKAYEDLVPPSYDNVNYQGPQEAMDVRVNPTSVERVGNSAMNDVTVDPQYKEAQLAQIAALQDLRDNGGLNLTDRANLNDLQNQDASRERGARGAIMDTMHARGMGNNGTELMALLNSQQGSANRQSDNSLRTAGMAQDRALQAGNSAAGLAGNMSNQDFQQQSAVAQARDSAAKFNAQMANQMGQFNNTQDLRAQTVNQQKSQDVNNSRAAASNNSQTMNKYTVPTTTYGQQAQRAGGIANMGQAQANYYGNQSAAAQKAQGGLWGGALEMGMKGASMLKGGGAATGAESTGGGAAAAGGGEQLVGYGAPGGQTMGGTPGEYNLGIGQSGPSAGDYASGGILGGMGWRYGSETPALGFSDGGVVPGRAQVQGDSPQNDTVQAMLSPGEVVVPRSVSTDPRKEAMLAALMNLRKKHGGM